MYAGLMVSLLLHASLLVWALWSIRSTSPLDLPEAPTIEAEIITPAEFTRLKQGDPEAKKLEAKAKEAPDPKVAKKDAKKPKPELAPPPAAEPPPAPPEETAKKKEPDPQPKPDPIAEKIAALTPPPPAPPSKAEKKKLEEERQKKAREEAKKKEAERKRKEEARKKKLEAERKRKAKKKKEDFSKSMHALLDKTPEKRGAPRTAPEPTTDTDYTGPTAGEREGSGNELTAREEDLLKGQISARLRECWRLPGGGGGTSIPVVTLKWSLRRDGSLDGQPRVEGGGRSDPAFRIAAESAVRAVTQCAPFDLPDQYYTSWKTIIWDFDPRHML